MQTFVQEVLRKVPAELQAVPEVKAFHKKVVGQHKCSREELSQFVQFVVGHTNIQPSFRGARHPEGEGRG